MSTKDRDERDAKHVDDIHDHLLIGITQEVPNLAAALQEFRDDPSNAYMFGFKRAWPNDPLPFDQESL